MPFQPFRYANIPLQRRDPTELVQALMQGYQAAGMPEQRRMQQQEMGLKERASDRAERELAMREQMSPLQQALVQAQAKQKESEAQKMQAMMNVLGMGGSQPQQIQGGAEPLQRPQRQPGLPQDDRTALALRNLFGISETPSQQMQREVETGKRKEFSKIDAKTYEDAISHYRTSNELGDSIDSLLEVFEKNPEIRDVVGPLNSSLTKYLGEKSARDVLGKVNALSGDLMQKMAGGLKGAFTGKEQGFIMSMKPNVNDPIDVAIGKIEALKALNDVGKERARLSAQYLSDPRQNISSIDALERARKEIKMPSIENIKPKSKLQKGLEDSAKPKMVKILSPYGGLHLVPADQVQEAIRRGGKRV